MNQQVVAVDPVVTEFERFAPAQLDRRRLEATREILHRWQSFTLIGRSAVKRILLVDDLGLVVETVDVVVRPLLDSIRCSETSPIAVVLVDERKTNIDSL